MQSNSAGLKNGIYLFAMEYHSSLPSSLYSPQHRQKVISMGMQRFGVGSVVNGRPSESHAFMVPFGMSNKCVSISIR